MAIKTISIKGTDSKDVAGQAKEALKGFDVKFLLFFASSIYDDTNPAAGSWAQPHIVSTVIPIIRIIRSALWRWIRTVLRIPAFR